MDLAKPRNDWRILLLVFTLAGVVESQAFGHLNAFTPLYLQQLHVPRRQIPEWTGILSALAPNVYALALARFLAGFVLGNTGVMQARPPPSVYC